MWAYRSPVMVTATAREETARQITV